MILTSDNIITVQDIADACGVSKTTAASALRGDPRVKRATRERISAKAIEMGYDPSLHQAARRLALRKHGRDVLNHIIAIAMPNGFYEIPYYTAILHGVYRELISANWGLLTLPDGPSIDAHDENVILPSLRRGDVDGVITPGYPEKMLQLMQRLQTETKIAPKPVVSMFWEAAGCPAVLADDEHTGYQAMSHLLDLGHRHIVQFVFRNEAGDPDSKRLLGARKAMQERGLDPDRYLHPYAMVGSWLNPWISDPIMRERTREEMAEEEERFLTTLRAYPEVTGIITLNDPSAIYTWYTLQHLGYRIPEDMSIVSCDDTNPKLDEQGNNQLTTVRLPLAEMGGAAARILLDLLSGNTVEQNRVIFPTELIARGSTAPPRVAALPCADSSL